MLDLQASTVIFQVLNFFILLGALSYFLYRPLTRVMREREQAIAARLQEADERTREATAARDSLTQETQHTREETVQILEKARTDAAQAANQILDKARTETDQLQEQAKRQIDEVERAALARAQKQVTTAAIALASSLIANLAGAAVHQALLDKILIPNLGLPTDRINLLRRSSGSGPDGVTVELAYPPSPELSERFAHTLTRMLGREDRAVPITFRVAPELLAGARLVAGTTAIDLSLVRVLEDLKTEIGRGTDRKPELT